MSESFGALKAREPSATYLVQHEPALVRGFELLATAHRGVAELRALVHALAIRGLLVSQAKEDRPASKLLVDILAAKDRLIAGGELRPDKPTEELSAADRPFPVPASWVWARFGALCINRDGERVPVSSEDRQARAKLFDYYGASGVIDKIDGYLFDKTLLLIGEDGANLINRATPIAFLASGKYWVNNHAHVIDATHPGLMEYLCLFINAISLEPYITGTAQPKMNQAKLNSIPVALPPLAEQHRIVARVEELMKLCVGLEQSGRLADEQHARLTSTLFDALAASESAHALEENWQRIAEHFDLLLDRPEAIDALEQAVLQLAVRGLLVLQDANDEPAGRLLGRLRAEQDRLISIGQIRREKLIPALLDDEAPFELPTSWAWARLGATANFIDYRGRTPVKTISGVPLITAKNVRQGFIKREPREYIAAAAYDGWMTRGFPRCGDLLFTTEAPLGNVAAIDIAERFALAQRVICLGLYETEMSGALSIFLQSPWMQDALAVQATGVTAQGIKSARLQLMPIPVPPLAEQYRIVVRVEELRRLCAQLRERLTEASRTQSQLADALVAEVVA